MCSGSCVPVPQGQSMDGEILRRCIWDIRRQWPVLSRKMIVCCHLQVHEAGVLPGDVMLMTPFLSKLVLNECFYLCEVCGV